MVLECLFRFLVSVPCSNYDYFKNCIINLAWFLVVKKIQMTSRTLIILFISLNLFSNDIETISKLYEKDGPFVAGEKLIKLKPGIHFLENFDAQQSELIIACLLYTSDAADE